MTAATAGAKAAILDLAQHIPAGRIATYAQFSLKLKVMVPQVAAVFAALSDVERARIPWWRIVADGGAIGRHPHRDEQMQRLRDEGLLVSPAGIVQDMAAVRVADLSPPRPGTPAPHAAPPPRARSRGMKDKPTSSV
jgi:methylated-DNA-protein-cysteine methyltransferase-like protein